MRGRRGRRETIKTHVLIRHTHKPTLIITNRAKKKSKRARRVNKREGERVQVIERKARSARERQVCGRERGREREGEAEERERNGA